MAFLHDAPGGKLVVGESTQERRYNFYSRSPLSDICCGFDYVVGESTQERRICLYSRSPLFYLFLFMLWCY